MDSTWRLLCLLLVAFPAFLNGVKFLPPPPAREIGNRKAYEYNNATTEFAVKMFHEITKETNDAANVVFSPLSVYLALGMLNVGARKKCSKQIEDVLGMKLGENPADMNIAVQGLIKSLNADSRNFRIANKIWQQKYFCYTQCHRFAKTLKEYYFSELGEVDFARNPKIATQQINKWVSNKTNGKIDKLMPEGMLGTDTRFVLTNAILFQGAWQHPFIKEYTGPRTFTVFQDGRAIKKGVPMMYVKEHFYVTYGYGSTYRLVELPYKNERFSMTIILPHRASEFSKLESSLDAKLLKKMSVDVSRGPKTLTEVHLPKFKISKSLKANDVLKALGIKDIFDPIEADLTDITGFRGMYVSAVTHEAYINVDEVGTEASGGTGIVTDDLTLDSIRINRPFLFFIQHKPTASIAFLGRVTDPSR